MGLMTFVYLVIGLKAPAVAVGQESYHNSISAVCPSQIGPRRFQKTLASVFEKWHHKSVLMMLLDLFL